MWNVFAIKLYQQSIMAFKILDKNVKKQLIRANNSYKESSNDFCPNLSNVVIDMLNILSAIYYCFWDISHKR